MQFYFLVVSPRNRGKGQGGQGSRGAEEQGGARGQGGIIEQVLVSSSCSMPNPHSPFPIPHSPFPHPLEIAKVLSN
ncbi:hypothetical protein A6V25_24535 [Nostoc sp. ATCC 53789]|nr:hypothetical protein A6V25_24535 [Nostoc sp. ATCC 53789]